MQLWMLLLWRVSSM